MKVVRGILLTVNVVLALALLAATLAATVRPSSCIWPSLLAYGYLPLLLANVVMVVVWGVMKKWYALISVAVVAVRWAFVGLFVQVAGVGKAAEVAEGAARVRVMTYNVHQFRGQVDTGYGSDSVARGFIELVDERQPDVLCMQEFSYPKGVDVADSLLVRGYNHHYGTYHNLKGMPYGTVVYSKLPITYVRRLDREKLLVDLMHEVGSFRVCCVHVGSYRFEEEDYKGIDRALHGSASASLRGTVGKVKNTILVHEKTWNQQLRPVVEESSLPLIVAGDMNDIPSSWFYHQMSRYLDDTFCERGIGLATTYNGGFPRFRIDMIFHSKGFRTVEHKRVKSTLSDHYPVVATMEFLP